MTTNELRYTPRATMPFDSSSRSRRDKIRSPISPGSCGEFSDALGADGHQVVDQDRFPLAADDGQ